MDGRVLAVSVGRKRLIELKQGAVETGIFKEPVSGRLRVEGVAIEGDEQADLDVHGGNDQAVYAYAREDYEFWEDVLGRSLPAGTFGENLLVSGLDLGGARIGDRWTAGPDGLVLAVTAPRIPCAKFAAKMGDPTWVKKFAAARRPGLYFRIESPGTVAAGDAVSVQPAAGHDVTIRRMNEIMLFDSASKRDLLGAGDALHRRAREWASAA